MEVLTHIASAALGGVCVTCADMYRRGCPLDLETSKVLVSVLNTLSRFLR